MSFLDAAFDIGKKVVGSLVGGSGGGGGGNTVIAPQYNSSSLIRPLDGAKGATTHTERRSMDPTEKAETQKEKQGKAGDDPIALAIMWGEFFKDLESNG